MPSCHQQGQPCCSQGFCLQGPGSYLQVRSRFRGWFTSGRGTQKCEVRNEIPTGWGKAKVRRFLKHHGIHCPCFSERLQVKRKVPMIPCLRKLCFFEVAVFQLLGKPQVEKVGFHFSFVWGVKTKKSPCWRMHTRSIWNTRVVPLRILWSFCFICNLRATHAGWITGH